MFVYRNRNTGDEVSYPVRSARLDHLPNWSLVSQPPPAATTLASGGEVQPGPVVTVGEHPPPSRGASTDAWRAWAVEHGGLTAEEAAGLSRNQLADRYAPREQQ